MHPTSQSEYIYFSMGLHTYKHTLINAAPLTVTYKLITVM